MATDDLFIKRDANFSPCRTWRYTLIRTWDIRRHFVLFILLNPSTADEKQDDPTNRRGIRYAMDWGFGGVVFCNLFAFRSPYPKVMKAADDPVGPENDEWIVRMTKHAGQVVLAWGAHGGYKDRDKAVIKLLKQECPEVVLHSLAMTKANQPKHILYLKASLKPEPVDTY